MLRKFVIYFLILSFALSSHSKTLNYYYMVKKNDNVSMVLYRAKLVPIYHKFGSLSLLRQKNEKHILDINKLFPGDKLFFPKALVIKAQNKDSIRLTSQNEIIFNDNIEQKTKDRRLANESNKANNPESNLPLIKDVKVEKSAEVMTQSSPQNFSQPQAESIAQSELEISLATGYAKLDSSSNSAGAVLLSRPALGANFKWQQNWSQSISSFIRWNYNSVSFQDTSRGSVSGSDKQTTSLMALGLNYRFTQTTRGLIELGTREEIFAPSYAVGTATLETKPITYARILFLKDLVEVRKLKLSGALGASYLLGLSSSSYNVSPGAEYLAQLKITHSLKSLSLFAVGEYSQTNQKTSLTNQTRKDIGMQLGIIIPLGKEEVERQKEGAQ